MKLTTKTTMFALLALGAVASADKADDLFKAGKKLMAEKKYAEACPKFEESFKLDPGLGGQLNIAKCYEEWGKLGRAYRAYLAAEKQAKDAGDHRESQIHDLATALEPQVPRLMIHIPSDADTTNLKLTIDGLPVDAKDLGNAQLVDPGPKQVEYLSDGTKKSKLVPVERGGMSEITLELPKAKPHEPVHEKVIEKPVASTPTPGRGQRIAGIAIGGVGVVAIGISSVMTLSARSKYKDALAKDCSGATNMCNAQGLTDTHDARHAANVATIVFSAGVAAVAGGVVLYLLAPHAAAAAPDDEHAFYVAPTASSDGAGLVFGGRL